MNKIMIGFIFLLCLLVTSMPIFADKGPAFSLGLEISNKESYYLQTSAQLPFWGIFYFSVNMLTPTTFNYWYTTFDGGAGIMIPLGGFHAIGEFSYIFLTNPNYASSSLHDSVIKAGINYVLFRKFSIFGLAKGYYDLFDKSEPDTTDPRYALLFGIRLQL